MKQSIHDAIRIAATTSKVPFFSALIAGTVSAGAEMIPEDLWHTVSVALANEDAEELDENEIVDGTGFWFEENHLLSESHEVWIEQLVPALIEGHAVLGRRKLWFIPVDELVCLVKNDDMARDFVSITRLFFAGTETEMREATAKLIANMIS